MITDISDDVPDRLISDPLRIRQVLVNLVSNALKFTRKGEICISIEVKGHAAESIELLFCVRDTGIGVPPGLKDKLFDVFTQADGSTTRKYGGTGLGLAICKRIVHMLGAKSGLKANRVRGVLSGLRPFLKLPPMDLKGNWLFRRRCAMRGL